MNLGNQEQLIGRIRSALGYPAHVRRNGERVFSRASSAETRQILDRVSRRSAAQSRMLLDRLAEAAEPINLQVRLKKDTRDAAAAICELAAGKTPEWNTEKRIAIWKHPLVDRLGLEKKLAEKNIDCFVTATKAPPPDGDLSAELRDDIRQKIAAAYIGVTGADFCMAATATLVMRNRKDQPRSAAVLPSIHIAVIEQRQIIFDLKELYALLKWDPDVRGEGLTNYMAFISGPSKTADIEATLVHGAHGPREVHLFVIAARD